jgi:hypothetical protein
MDIAKAAGWAMSAAVITAGSNVSAAGVEGTTLRIDPADCAGFSSRDAAPFLGATDSQVVRKAERLSSTLYMCSYALGAASPGVAFSVELVPDVKRAAAEMERYRDNLMTAGETPPWKGRLPKGAYSDLSGPGLGDEAVWTDINGALTVRKANVKIQVTLPKGKMAQVKLVQAVTAKF